MSLAWPYLLWLLVVPAALLAWELTRRRNAAASDRPKLIRAEAGARTLHLAPSDPSPDSGLKPRLWLLAGLTLAIVALARPQWGRTEEQVFDQSREILLAIDLSRSMLSQDVKPSRLDRAKLLIQSLLERLAGERVGLVVFSGTAFLQSPLSADYEILREFLPALNTDYLPEGGTNYRALLETAEQAFGGSSAADRFLIVLSDGEATDDDWRPMIENLKKKGIRVIGLGVGTATGAMIPDGSGGFLKDDRGAVVLSKLESGTLEELAQATNGAYRDASSWIDLPTLLQDTVEAGHKGDFVEKNQVRLIERFQWALAPALLCLLVSFWREFPVQPKPRELMFAPEPRGQKPEIRTAVAAMIVLFLLTSGLWPLASLRAADGGEDILAAPLSKVVGRIAGQDTRSAADWAELSRTTLTYGQRLQSEKQAVPEGPVRDALSGVEAGAAMDAKAADWPQLHRDLEDLLKKSDEQKKDQPPPQKQPEQNQSQQQKQDQPQQQQQDQSSQPQSSAGQKSGQPDQAGQPEQQPSKPGGQDPRENQSAFGDMKAPAPKPDNPPGGETQKVGGTPEKKPADEKDADPAMALPLQKLDQLRNADSPARLFQLMDADNKKPESLPKNGKNW
jgi:Ca-activated chloride channel family protein